MPKKPKRKKNGKIKAWQAHMICKFTKPNDTNTYIERCTVKVDKPNLAEVKGTEEVYAAVDDWVTGLVESEGYNKKFVLGVEKWVAVRS
jgi:hypothetical protein